MCGGPNEITLTSAQLNAIMKEFEGAGALCNNHKISTEKTYIVIKILKKPTSSRPTVAIPDVAE